MAAARRGRSQARRTGGHQGTPGWVWLVAGAAIAAVVFLAAPDLFHKKGDFLRAGPRPDPDAQPAPVADAGIDEADGQAPATSTTDKSEATDAGAPQYDFYTLLPGKEVQMSDAEIAATSKAEAARRQAQEAARAKALLEGRDPGPALPAPVTAAATPAAPPVPAEVRPATETASPPAPAPSTTKAETVAGRPSSAETAMSTPAPTTPAAAPAQAGSGHYLLQAGSFGGSGDAENVKARIAMLGLSARVESARIGDKTVYRVRMGPYASATELAAAKQKLASGGLQAIAIRAQ